MSIITIPGGFALDTGGHQGRRAGIDGRISPITRPGRKCHVNVAGLCGAGEDESAIDGMLP